MPSKTKYMLAGIITGLVLLIIGSVSVDKYIGKMQDSENAYNEGQTAFDSGDWNKAKELFSEVAQNSPYYQKAQNGINNADDKITTEKINNAVATATQSLKAETNRAEQQAAKAAQQAAQASQALQESNKENIDISSVVSQWEPLVGWVFCSYRYGDTGNLYLTDSGSGIAIKFTNQPISVLTNKHVVTDESGTGAIAYQCGFAFPGAATAYLSKGDWQGITTWTNEDAANINVDNPDDYLTKLTSSFPKICAEKAVEGDKILILGYPGIGSSESITATQGIISGFEGDYYVTDAKIDHGNSGGAAILLKDDCLLGLTTYVVSGQLESLGRILDINTIIK